MFRLDFWQLLELLLLPAHGTRRGGCYFCHGSHDHAFDDGLQNHQTRAPQPLQTCWAWIAAKTTAPRFVMCFLWIQILLGWLLATLFVAGVTGIVHKD
jgi:hypothetical protein